ncbi:MAG: HEAT repeat domain-containing protein, partial [Planctomycetota bacterium]
KKRNASFVRPFAAISLGLLGNKNDADDKVSQALFEILKGKESKPDVKPASLVALGLLGDDANVPKLLELLDKRKVEGGDELNDVELAFVVQALGKTGRPGVDDNANAVVDALSHFLTKGKKKANTNVRRSSAIALGQIAPQCEPKAQQRIVNILKDVAKDGGDASERNFAMVAIGRIASTDGIGENTRTVAIKTLSYYLNKGKPANLAQPFAALSMGLVGRAMVNASMAVPEEDIRKPLRKKFDDGGEPRARGAYAIASGLVRDPLAVPALVKMLKDRGGDKRLRGYSAVSLGMIRSPEARDAIRSALSDDTDRDLRVQTAVAAGLMGDASVITDLVKILESGEESQYILGSVALALGQIGDERAIEPLLNISQDEAKKFPDITRALATVALGQIGDRRDVPVLSRVARDINFRAIGQVPSLTELLTIL